MYFTGLMKTLTALLLVAVFLSTQQVWGIERRRPTQTKPSYVQGEVLVMFQSGVPRERIDDINRIVGASVLKNTGRLYVIGVPQGQTVEGLVERYNAMPGVDYAEPNYIYTIQQ